MRLRSLVLVAALMGCSLVSGCTQSVFDFPVATMIGQQRGYTMTGYVGTHDDQVARAKVIRRLEPVCPNGANIVDFKTTRADAAIGTKILRYEVMATCKS